MNIVEVKFDNCGQTSFYRNNNLNLKNNLTVIVDGDRGLQFGKVVNIVKDVSKFDNVDLYNVVRISTKKDYLQHIDNLNCIDEAIKKCRELASKNGLNMTILDGSYNFDRSQLLFRFVADERVDFRQLAKDLGAVFRTRIELRQIGIRDKAKEIGGIGPCGRFLCCSTFLTNFDTVSISMAKNQGLALNPTKINGVCGRLLCCLNYENEQYLEARKDIPDVGKKVMINGKEGKVITSEPLLYKYKVLVDDELIEVDKNDSTK